MLTQLARANWMVAPNSSSMSPWRSDYIITGKTGGVGHIFSDAWRVVSEDSCQPEGLQVFPADCPHLSDCHCPPYEGEYRRIHRSFQHIARFINVTTTITPYSYGRRLPGLQISASPPKRLTHPFNLPAPGRCQSLYVVLRLSRDLCF